MGGGRSEKEAIGYDSLRRIGEPQNVARVVAWLASDSADYITGATIYVDDGMTLYPEFRYGG